MAVVIPAAVRLALTGRPTVGEFDQAVMLITADEDGWERVCLLSRAAFSIDGERIAIATASASTSANLERSRQALLVVVADDAAHYCRLRLDRSMEWPGHDIALHAALFTVEGVKIDRLPDVSLEPMRFLATATLPAIEAWDQTAAAHRQITKTPTDPRV